MDFNWTDTVFSKTILHSLHDFQKTNFMCDIKLTVENESIMAHKLVLNAASPYFRYLDGGGFAENTENEIKFKNLDFKTLQLIIEYIYSGRIVITEANVVEVMEAADMFRISTLKPVICNFLIRNLNHSDCFQTLAYAKTFNYIDLYDYVLDYIWNNFETVSSRDSFLDIPCDIFELVICSSSPILEDLITAFSKWIEHNIKYAKQFKLDKKNFDIQNFKTYLRDLIATDSPFKDFLQHFTDFFNFRFSDELRLRNEIKLFDQPCLNRRAETQAILVFGGETNQQDIENTNRVTIGDVECFINHNWSLQIPQIYNPNEPNEQISLEIPTMRTPRCQFAIASKKYQVYILGGNDSNNAFDSSEMYDVRTNEWTEFTSIPKALHGCQATFSDNILYLLGGMETVDGDEVATNEVWKYSERERRWRKFPGMQQARAYHGACSVRGVLYVMGGIGGLACTVERYCESLERWVYVTSMPENKCNFGCIAYNDSIFTFGGITRTEEILDSSHKYNTLEDKWEYHVNMLYHKFDMASVVKEGRIFVIGGADNIHGPLGTTESIGIGWDGEDQDWLGPGRWNFTSSKLRKERRATGAAVVWIPCIPKFRN